MIPDKVTSPSVNQAYSKEQELVPRRTSLEIAVNLYSQLCFISKIQDTKETKILRKLSYIQRENIKPGSVADKVLEAIGSIALKKILIEISSSKLKGKFDNVLKQYEHLARRNELNLDHPEIKNIKNTNGTPSSTMAFHQRYEGQAALSTAFIKHGEAKSLLESLLTKEEKIPGSVSKQQISDLQKLVKHREVILKYEKLARDFDTSRDTTLNAESEKQVIKICEALSNDIEELANPNSDKVVHIDDKTTSFTFPGGTPRHYMEFEFRKEGSEYYVVIHNRGLGLSDTDIHGENSIILNGKEYVRSNVKIAVSLEQMKDPAFLKDLVSGLVLYPSKESTIKEKKWNVLKTNMTRSYGAIKEHLIQKGATIVVSEEEKALEKVSIDLEDKIQSYKDRIQSRISETKEEQLTLKEELSKLYAKVDNLDKEISHLEKKIEILDKNVNYQERKDLKNLRNNLSDERTVFTKEGSRKYAQIREIDKSLAELTQQSKEDDTSIAIRLFPEELKELTKAQKKLIESKQFNAKQLYGTCTESNRQSSEKSIAGPEARAALKLYSFQGIVKQLSYNIKPKEAKKTHTEEKDRQYNEDRDFIVTRHAPKQLEHLQNKMKMFSQSSHIWNIKK